MATITNADLQARVLAALDEVTPQGSEPSVPADILDDQLEDGAEDVLLEAAPALVVEASEDIGPVPATETTYGAQQVVLPEDVLRILQVRFAGWNTIISERDLLDSHSDSYRQVRTGQVCIDADRPVAVLTFVGVVDEPTNTKVGRTALEGYPIPDPEAETPLPPEAVELMVVNRPEQPDAVPEVLVDPLVWKTAARIASSYLRDYQAATACTEQYRQSMGRRELRHDRLAQDEKRSIITQRPYRLV